MEILIKAVDATNPDPEKDLRGCYKKGDPISIKLDGWAEGNPNWHQSKYAQYLGTRLVVVRCPQITVAQAQNYVSQWEKVIGYEVLSSTPANGNYQIRVFGENVSATGQNSLTREQIENYLLKWNCTVDSIAPNEVTFTLRLWQALQSAGFWNSDDSGLIGFTLVSYDEQSGDAIVDMNISGVLAQWTLERIATSVIDNGGSIVNYTEPVGRFSINRSIVLNKFQSDVKEKIDTTYCRRQFYFNSSDIDIIIAAGGIITLNKNQLLNQINSKLDD